ALEDPAALEEERRLCYVGITRAQEQLFISYATERRLYGNREVAIPSLFLSELPKELIELDKPGVIPRQLSRGNTLPISAMPKAQPATRNSYPQQWSVGDRLEHPQFGQGQITHVFGSGGRVTIAVKFPSIGQQKILDPRIAPIQKIN
ncbi:MAG: 3'-5' exonuclease, partial [Thermostichus sp. DG02_5_bins_236]